MRNISKIERKNEILKLLQTKKSIAISELATFFQVSLVTLRSDIRDIEKTGSIVRSNGIVLLKKNLFDNTSRLNNNDFSLEKQKIGKKALSFIEKNDSIIIDSGSTTNELVKLIQKNSHGFDKLTVMTNALNIATNLALCDFVEVFMTGGKLINNSLSFVGRQAEESLTNYHFDKLFLAAQGVDVTFGATTIHEQEATLNKIMCDIAKTVILVADSSKLKKKSHHVIVPISRIDILITDENIANEDKNILEDKGIKVVIA